MNRRYVITVDGISHDVSLITRGADSLTFSVAGETHQVTIEAPIESAFAKIEQTTSSRAPSAARTTTSSSAHGQVAAPMPGIVTKISCAVGDSVKRGTPLLVIEAMKMENNINAPIDGTIHSITVNAGDEVKKGDTLIVVQ